MGFFLVFMVYPLGFSLFLIFHKWIALDPRGPIFIGFQNFVEVFTADTRFWVGFRNTFLIVVVASVSQVILGLGIALLFAKKNLKGVNIFKLIILIPMVVMPVATGSIWKTMFHYEAGPVNHWLTVVDLPRVRWLLRFPEGIFAFIVADIWQWTPFIVLASFAGLYSLPKEPFEAAVVDGATPGQVFRYITFPLLRRLLLIIFLLRTIELFKEFDKIFTLTGGGPGYSTETMSLYIYRVGLNYFRMGYAASLSYVFLLISIAVFTLLLKAVREG